MSGSEAEVPGLKKKKKDKKRSEFFGTLQYQIFKRTLLLGLIPIAILWAVAFVPCMFHGLFGIEQNLRAVWLPATIAAAALAVVVALVAFFSSANLMKPIKRLIRAVNSVKGGREDEFTPVSDYLETERLSDACASMLEELKNIDRTQQEFVSNVSHELKTPMTSMKVLADSLVGQNDVPVEVYREFMEDIGAEIDRETTIVNDLLALSRLEKASSKMEIKSVNINGLLTRIKRKMTPIAQKNGILLLLDNIRSVTAEVDESMLETVITNLVENAIKYNRVGGWVRMVLDLDRRNFTVTVSDNGIGIPEEAQEQIFERFYRADKSHSKTVSGSGLGLSLVRKSVKQMHGTIKVTSAPEEGSTFTVTIPLEYRAR